MAWRPRKGEVVETTEGQRQIGIIRAVQKAKGEMAEVGVDWNVTVEWVDDGQIRACSSLVVRPVTDPVDALAAIGRGLKRQQ